MFHVEMAELFPALWSTKLMVWISMLGSLFTNAPLFLFICDFMGMFLC